MNQLRALLKTMRPKQWTKNVFVFAALVFDEKVFQGQFLWPTVIGFFLFCLVSGVVYIFNDLADLEKDRQHPRKRERPLPAGNLSPKVAIIGAVIMAIGTIGMGMWLNPSFGLILILYLLLQLGYSFYLKNFVLLDVLAIAVGFVLRVAGGVPLVVAERFSPWLYICTTLLALFLGFGKRRGELVLLGNKASDHRESLEHYNLPLLDQLIDIVTASTILAYALYTFSAPNLPQSHLMMLTIPFVLYGLFRYLYLIHVQGTTLAPDEVLLVDRAIQVDLVLWGLASVGILYWGK
ncbi:MAG: decaprenyl-phosphate phosphoribosyltransferase [Anaerolineae bacterium]|nr:decaprenyl-phosphate phosphoribosyltransferase [Anaerolineae bacterium]